MRICCLSDFVRDDLASLLAAVGLDPVLLGRIAANVGWVVRPTRKTDASGLVAAVCSEALRGSANPLQPRPVGGGRDDDRESDSLAVNPDLPRRRTFCLVGK